MSTPSIIGSAFTIDWAGYIHSVTKSLGVEQSQYVLKVVLKECVEEDPHTVLSCLFGKAPSDPVALAKSIINKFRSHVQDRSDLPPIHSDFLDCLTPVQSELQYAPTSVPKQIGYKRPFSSPPPRHTIEKIRREILTLDYTCGIYQRYGCDNIGCKRCRLIFVTYPVSPCSKFHRNSESCTASGYYPHVTRKTWEELHAMRNFPPSFVVRGDNLKNPLQRSFLTELGRRMHAKKKNTQQQERVPIPDEPQTSQLAESRMDEDSSGSTAPSSDSPPDLPPSEVLAPRDCTRPGRKKRKAPSSASSAPDLSLEDSIRMLSSTRTVRSFDIALCAMFKSLGLDVGPDSPVFFANNSRDVVLPDVPQRGSRHKV